MRKAKILILELLSSDLAKYKFYQWIKYQGGDITKIKDKAKKYIVLSSKDGYVNGIDALELSQLVFDLGAGRVKKTDKIDYAVGVTINKPIGSRVRKGDILGVIYYNKKVENMNNIFENTFKIGKKKTRSKKIIIKTVK